MYYFPLCRFKWIIHCMSLATLRLVQTDTLLHTQWPNNGNGVCVCLHNLYSFQPFERIKYTQNRWYSKHSQWMGITTRTTYNTITIWRTSMRLCLQLFPHSHIHIIIIKFIQTLYPKCIGRIRYEIRKFTLSLALSIGRHAQT